MPNSQLNKYLLQESRLNLNRRPCGPSTVRVSIPVQGGPHHQPPPPPQTIFLCIFAAPWLTAQIVAMECAVGQKERRSRNSVTSWRGLTLFLPPLTPFVHSLSLSLVLSLCIRSSFSLSLSLYFDAGPGTLAWPFSSFSLLQNTKHGYIQHTHT